MVSTASNNDIKNRFCTKNLVNQMRRIFPRDEALGHQDRLINLFCSVKLRFRDVARLIPISREGSVMSDIVNVFAPFWGAGA